MLRNTLYAGTALGLCIMMQPGALGADTTLVSEDELQIFSPLIQPCVAEPTAANCAEAGSLVPECAADIELDRCELLLAQPAEVLADSELSERTQSILTAVQQELDGTDADVLEDLGAAIEDAMPDDVEEAVSELLSDEVVGDVFETLSAETADPTQPEAEPAQDADTETVEDSPAPQESDGEIDMASEADAVDESTEDEAMSASDSAEEDQDTRAAILQMLEAERERLLAEAEELASEAPELVIEETPEEEFVAPVEVAREPDADERAILDRLMDNPEIADAVSVLGAALGLQSAADADPEAERQPSATRDLMDGSEQGDESVAEVIEEAITTEQLRSSREDFASRLSIDFDATTAQPSANRDRRDLERAGLAALGALAVGMIINQNRVVARSDERVVVDQGQGDLQLWRDDDAILLQDGSTRRIERFNDGSTRTRWERLDGTEVVTIRDATGRVLRRERILADGTIVELIDDTRAISPIIVSELPPIRTRELRVSERTDPELALAMLQQAEEDARAMDRSFSLRQIRETRELRELLPLLSPDPITFETNRANVRAEEVSKLLQVGRLIERLIATNPREVFLIEGHTDATGPAAFNLALSDRRAESVALALTEFFDIPPENLVVQGYGERHLRIPTLSSEERNRRVAIRRITPLLGG
ncbi:MAG: OmpA family protein [Roseinatronobacter sp.]